jgi:hypothetical protein
MKQKPLSTEEQMARITDVQARYTDALMRKKNVIGVAVGLSTDDDEDVAHYKYCLVVLVSEKVPERLLDSEDEIPEMIEGVPVEVREMGTFLAG